MNIELATPEDAEEWRYHLDECRVMNESGIVVTRTDLVCPLTCVVPDDIACLDVGSRLTANVAFTLIGQQVTLVQTNFINHGLERQSVGTATVVNVVKVWEDLAEGDPGCREVVPRLLMQIEVTAPQEAES